MGYPGAADARLLLRHPRAAVGGARRVDPHALGPRHRARRHGLHARLAGRHAHRRAKPDAADDPGRAALLRQHDPALPPAAVGSGGVQLAGLHHVTCVCSNAQQTLDFYRDLGFALVKKTVNFDDPHSYHLYFGDETGSPGTLMTFFEWPRAERGRLGRGTLESIGLNAPSATEETEFDDPDGLRLRLYPAETPSVRDVVVIGNPDLYVGVFADDAPLSFGD